MKNKEENETIKIKKAKNWVLMMIVCALAAVFCGICARSKDNTSDTIAIFNILHIGGWVLALASLGVACWNLPNSDKDKPTS
ncbi:MAG: hypothetical protein NTU97_03560 [Candidatus Magasanikbacteria bacterium]|nr:hypothetical protein [Candidatus Magasanikbacteria bacterium]